MRVLRSRARSCLSPPALPGWPRIPSLCGPGAAGSRDSLKGWLLKQFPKNMCVDGWVGLVLRSLECSHVAGQHLLLLPAPARALHEVTPPCVRAPHSGLRTPARRFPEERSPVPGLWDGQGLAGAAASLTGVASFLRRCPSAHAPFLGAALGRGLRQVKVPGLGPPGP